MVSTWAQVYHMLWRSAISRLECKGCGTVTFYSLRRILWISICYIDMYNHVHIYSNLQNMKHFGKDFCRWLIQLARKLSLSNSLSFWLGNVISTHQSCSHSFGAYWVKIIPSQNFPNSIFFCGIKMPMIICLYVVLRDLLCVFERYPEVFKTPNQKKHRGDFCSIQTRWPSSLKVKHTAPSEQEPIEPHLGVGKWAPKNARNFGIIGWDKTWCKCQNLHNF